MDVAEVNAWLTLDQLHADSGWEATVVRQARELDIKVRAADPAREQQFRESFQSEPGIKIDTVQSAETTTAGPFLAQRSFGGDSPALAQDWLEQQFPDIDDRSHFVNRALALSKEVLGRAFFLDQLDHSRAPMPSSEPGDKLSELIARKRASLIASQSALAATIRPLVGDLKRSASKPLSYDDARKLDAALGALLAASGHGDAGYQADLDAVRGLL
jgi:hypothetical protein